MRRFIFRIFAKYPFIEAIVELIFTLFFSFVPILVAALIATSRSDKFETTLFTTTFFSFFQKGELSLVMLGLCGSILFILLMRTRGSLTALIGLIVLGVVFIVGAVVGDNPGFGARRPAWILQSMFWGYVGLNVVWLFASLWANQTVDDDPQRDVSNAENILAEANRRREK